METKRQSESQGPDPLLCTLSSSSNVRLIPYVQHEGQWTLPDEWMLMTAVRAQQDGMLRHVFYDGSVKCAQDFVTVMQRPRNYPVFAFLGEQMDLVGWAWLNDMNGARAWAHFCGTKGALGKHTLEAGRMIVGYWMAAMQHIDFLFGLTPGNNRMALAFIRRVGFQIVGEVPGLLYDAYCGEKVPGVISYYSRDEHGRKQQTNDFSCR